MESIEPLRPIGLLTIPIELRQQIYRCALHPKIISLFDQGNRKRPNKKFQPILTLFLTCRTIYAEAYEFYFSECTILIKNYHEMQGNSESSRRLAHRGNEVFQKCISKMPPRFRGIDSPLRMARHVRLEMPYSCSVPFFAELCLFLPTNFPALQELHLVGSKFNRHPCMGYTPGTIRWDEKETTPESVWVKYFVAMCFRSLNKVIVTYYGRYRKEKMGFEEFFDGDEMKEYFYNKLCRQ